MDYYKTFELPLEPHEVKKLKRSFIFIPIFTVLFGAFFFFLFNNMGIDDGWAKWAVIGFAVFFVIIILIILRGFALDLRDQTKQVFQGLITRKVRRRSKGKNKSSTSYYFYFGDKSMKVELNLYHKFQEADLIEIHRSKRLYNMIYDSKLIKRGVMVEEVSELKRIHEEKENRLGVIIMISVLVIVGIILTVIFLT